MFSISIFVYSFVEMLNEFSFELRCQLHNFSFAPVLRDDLYHVVSERMFHKLQGVFEGKFKQKVL